MCTIWQKFACFVTKLAYFYLKTLRIFFRIFIFSYHIFRQLLSWQVLRIFMLAIDHFPQFFIPDPPVDHRVKNIIMHLSRLTHDFRNGRTPKNLISQKMMCFYQFPEPIIATFFSVFRSYAISVSSKLGAILE